jgi:chitinase
VASLAQNLDALHVMTYDLHGSWESTVGHHAPLYSTTAGDQLTVDYA